LLLVSAATLEGAPKPPLPLVLGSRIAAGLGSHIGRGPEAAIAVGPPRKPHCCWSRQPHWKGPRSRHCRWSASEAALVLARDYVYGENRVGYAVGQGQAGARPCLSRPSRGTNNHRNRFHSGRPSGAPKADSFIQAAPSSR
jgi:hypothetical protein